ncbi:MAG: nickel pincer cofactor biosynthesis protein LarC [Methanomicrobiales archaeon]|nr:nickel pincer cofactor biosynthesis protein LarC [Methanomicrobiales archaeon]
MRLLAFDPFHGAAGDMICGALLSLGAPPEPVMKAMGSVVRTPRIEQVSRCGISAVKIHTLAGPACRTLDEVFEIIRRADAPTRVIERAEKIFLRIAKAEESVHGNHHVHFHEVGADDAIADIIGSCMAYHLINPDRVISLPVATGYGTFTCSHGTLPVPAPATTAILTGTPILVMSGNHAGEQLTPTGAAILAELCDEGLTGLPTGKILKIGNGAGSRDDTQSPNILVTFLMETNDFSKDVIDILETNVDDISGEIIGSFLAQAIDEGARDASAIPILMKKGRPGFLIRVIAPPSISAVLAEKMARELGTLGIRITPAVHRFIAKRSIRKIPVTINGETILFPIKFGYIGDSCYLVKPEFDFAEIIAKKHDIPVRRILHYAHEAGKQYMERGEDF